MDWRFRWYKKGVPAHLFGKKKNSIGKEHHLHAVPQRQQAAGKK
jgi:hypothetical protein